MRKIYEIVMVIAAAGLAAAVALIDIPTDSAGPGAVIGGDKLFAAPPPIAPTFPPLPPLLTPPGSSTPVPTDPAATPASPLRVQPQGVTAAASASVGVPGAASVPRAPTTTTDPPAAKTKPAARAPVKTKPKPPPPAKAKPKPKPPAKTKPKPPPPKGETKPKDRRKSASTGSSPRSRPSG